MLRTFWSFNTLIIIFGQLHGRGVSVLFCHCSLHRKDCRNVTGTEGNQHIETGMFIFN